LAIPNDAAPLDGSGDAGLCAAWEAGESGEALAKKNLQPTNGSVGQDRPGAVLKCLPQNMIDHFRGLSISQRATLKTPGTCETRIEVILARRTGHTFFERPGLIDPLVVGPIRRKSTRGGTTPSIPPVFAWFISIGGGGVL
jgi:hypothetical protein